MRPGDPLQTYRVRRRGSPARDATLASLRPRFGVSLDQLGPAGGFRPVVLDIGFGDGAATLAAARAEPGRALLAVDVHTPGVAALLEGLADERLDHVRVHEGDARAVLARLAPDSLLEVRVLFPDPWPKARHAKRRLVTPAFVAQVAGLLAPGGRWHVATDWPPYARAIRAAVDATPTLQLVGHDRGTRPVTRYERRGLAAGRVAVDLVARRVR